MGPLEHPAPTCALLRYFFFFQAEDGIRDSSVTGVQTCALPISSRNPKDAAKMPLLAWFSWRRGGVPLTAAQLLLSGIFAASFGFLEAVVVVYLRAATGLLPEIGRASCRERV